MFNQNIFANLYLYIYIHRYIYIYTEYIILSHIDLLLDVNSVTNPATFLLVDHDPRNSHASAGHHPTGERNPGS